MADVIIAIAGSHSTYGAGFASILMKKKLIPIPYFGGAAEDLRELLEHEPTPPISKDDLSCLDRPWSEQLKEDVIRLTGIDDYPNIIIVHGRSKDYQVVKKVVKDMRVPEPIVMVEDNEQEGQHLEGAFTKLARDAHAAIIMLTADEESALTIDGKGATIPKKRRHYVGQARKNVYLELGWLWQNPGLNRTLILYKGRYEDLMPTDLAGLKITKYEDVQREEAAMEAIRIFVKKLKS
jgi:Predicted nucleotide-binding protein containing TIR-like domain